MKCVMRLGILRENLEELKMNEIMKKEKNEVNKT